MIEIEGPYSFKNVDGLKTPAYIFLPGGVRKNIGEVTVKVSGGMTFDVQLEDKYKDIETAFFDVPMRYTYLNLPKPRVDWVYNCLTEGIHHGRRETLWTLPLFQASMMFGTDGLKQLVVARIFTDAMQFVEHGNEPRMPTEWAYTMAELADKEFDELLDRKMTEITDYYESSNWRSDVKTTIERVKQNKLNPHYKPLHSHDSINMLCRILGTQCSQMVE